MADKKTAKTAKIRKRMIKEILKCDLTDKELLEYGADLADKQDEAARLDSQLQSYKKEMQGKIEVLQAQVEGLGGKLRAKYEHRDVECELTEDFTAKRVKIVRLDTGAVVKERNMNAKELEELPLDTTDVPVDEQN